MELVSWINVVQYTLLLNLGDIICQASYAVAFNRSSGVSEIVIRDKTTDFTTEEKYKIQI